MKTLTEKKNNWIILDKKQRILRDLRISVIDKCNFRCSYCMPTKSSEYQFLSKRNLLSFNEILRLAKIFVDLGIRKIKITGGEPLLRVWVPDLIRELKKLPGLKEVALITNGYYLSSMASRLKKSGLDRVTVSLDSIDPENFQTMNGRGYKIDKVLRGIESALEAGFSPVKINMVVIKGKNHHEVVKMLRRFSSPNYILRYIEYMDAGNVNSWRREEVFTSEKLLSLLSMYYTLTPLEPNYSGEVAGRYRIKETGGELGFISSVSEPFCNNCTRGRITADGRFYTCLFSPNGLNLKSLLLKKDDDRMVREEILRHWNNREDQYSKQREAVRNKKKIEMYHMGG